MNRRTLGFGVTNYSYWLTKNGLSYESREGNTETHKLFEAIQYYLIKASVKLAREKGKCPKFEETTYSKGVMPIDRYKKSIDKFHDAEYLQDWDSLKKRCF